MELCVAWPLRDRLAQESLGSHSIAAQAPSPRPRAGARIYNGSGTQASSRPAQGGRTCPSPPPVPSHISGVHIAWNDTERALAAWTDAASGGNGTASHGMESHGTKIHTYRGPTTDSPKKRSSCGVLRQHYSLVVFPIHP